MLTVTEKLYPLVPLISLPLTDFDPVDAHFGRELLRCVHGADPAAAELVGEDQVEGMVRPGSLHPGRKMACNLS